MDLRKWSFEAYTRVCISFIRSFALGTPGIMVMQFLNEYRLSIACQLLTETSRSIGSIAQDCGFAGSSHFCTVFRANEGVSPREFRKLKNK